MFQFLRDWRDHRLTRRFPIDDGVWAQTLAAIPILQHLSAEESARLRNLAALFLHRKTFIPARGLELLTPMRTRIAAQACYPILNLDLRWYEGWSSVIVYPGQFLRPRRQIDDIGVMHEWTEVLRGEAWEHGPVVLSWADVAGSGLGEGYNVIIHELAHKLDMLNGEADGFPPLHRAMRVRSWTEAFSDAYAELNGLLDRGEDPPIDPYAADSPAEYFAVLSEYFFELPQLIRSAYPRVYGLLAEFYRQDPARRAEQGNVSGRGRLHGGSPPDSTS